MAIAKGLSINQAERCVVMQGFYEQLEIAQQSQYAQEASIKVKLYDIIEDNSLGEDEKQSLRKPLIKELEEIENKHIRIRRSILIGIYVVVTLPAHAERYSSGGEAFFVGALQGLFLMLVFWVWSLIKGGKSKTKETQHKDTNNTGSKQNTENTISKMAQSSLSPWEKYKMDNADTAKAVESLIKGDLQYLSEKDILEKIATFKRMSKRFDCPISELRDVLVDIFVSKFNTEELRDVVDRLIVKSELESREYCISEENTMSYYAQIWLSDYLYNTLNMQR